MKTTNNTAELNKLHRDMFDSVQEYVWFPVKVLCPKENFKSEEEVDHYFQERSGEFSGGNDYCGVRTVEGRYQVRFPIFQLSYMVEMDTVILHMILDELEEENDPYLIEEDDEDRFSIHQKGNGWICCDQFANIECYFDDGNFYGTRKYFYRDIFLDDTERFMIKGDDYSRWHKQMEIWLLENHSYESTGAF